MHQGGLNLWLLASDRHECQAVLHPNRLGFGGPLAGMGTGKDIPLDPDLHVWPSVSNMKTPLANMTYWNADAGREQVDLVTGPSAMGQ